MHSLTMISHLPIGRGEVFPFFADAANLARITPGELGFEILTALPIEMDVGTLIDYRIRLWGVPMRWRTRIDRWEPGTVFSDEQLRGPYRVWHHTHEFRDRPDGGTTMTDFVKFALPCEPFSALALPLVKFQLRHIFTLRDKAMRQALGLPAAVHTPEIDIRRLP